MNVTTPILSLSSSACAVLLTLALVTAGGSGRAEPAAPDTATVAQNERIVRKAFDAWTGGESVFDLLSPDVIWTIHGSGPVADTYKGVEDFVQRASVPLVSRLATPLTPEVHNIWAVGDIVVIRFDAAAITTSGAPYGNEFVWIWTIEDGVVVEAEAFLDLVAYQEVVDNNEPREQ